ncbi:MAG: SH3 domain-containing protein [Devosia sp.]
MNVIERITWFKHNFGEKIAAATQGTPISVDLVTAIAVQETGYIWPALIRHHQGDVVAVLEGCVGDTLDTPNRRAFPVNRTALEAEPYGEQMFDIGRAALAGLAELNVDYRRVYERDPDKFCRGYGILQYDLQHIRSDPDYFLGRQWGNFEICLQKCLNELEYGLRVRGFENQRSLSNFDAATVAIVYNTGRYRASDGLEQGHYSAGKHYGEWVFEYIGLSQGVAIGTDIAIDTPTRYRVTARSGLRLRGGPGTEYRILDTTDYGVEIDVLRFAGPADDWALVDLEGDGGLDGFMFADFLEPVWIAPGSNVEDSLRLEMALESAPGFAGLGSEDATEPDR